MLEVLATRVTSKHKSAVHSALHIDFIQQDGVSAMWPSSDLLLIQTVSYQQISSDENSAGAGTELLHDYVPLFLLHVTVLRSKKYQELLSHEAGP